MQLYLSNVTQHPIVTITVTKTQTVTGSKMPLTIAEISKLKMLSTAIFKGHICESCGEDFYTIRHNARFCCNACRQMNYRKKDQIDEVINEVVDSSKTELITTRKAKLINNDNEDLDEKIKKYSNNLIQIKNAR